MSNYITGDLLQSRRFFLSFFSCFLLILGVSVTAFAQVTTTVELKSSFSLAGHSTKLSRIQAVLGATPFSNFQDGQRVTLTTSPAGIQKLAEEGLVDQVIGVTGNLFSGPNHRPKRRYVRWEAELSIEKPAEYTKTMLISKDTKWFSSARRGMIFSLRDPNIPISQPHDFLITALNSQGIELERIAYIDPRTAYFETFEDDGGISGGGEMQFERIKFVFWLLPHDDVAEIQFLMGNLNSAHKPRLIASAKVR